MYLSYPQVGNFQPVLTAGATVDFTVRLGRAASASVTLSFDKGDTSKTVSLPVMVPALVEHGNDVLQMTV